MPLIETDVLAKLQVTTEHCPPGSFIKSRLSNVKSVYASSSTHDSLHPSGPPITKINRFVHIRGWWKLKINLDQKKKKPWHLSMRKSWGWLIKNLLPGNVSARQSHSQRTKGQKKPWEGKMQEECGRREKGEGRKVKHGKISPLPFLVFCLRMQRERAGPLQYLTL